MSEVSRHFDAVAAAYDFWKRRNSYYYDNLKALYRELVPPDKAVLDFGCGTGEVLETLNPARGVGIDISPNMVERAREKFRGRANLYFTHDEADPHLTGETYDYIISADVVEHLEDVEHAVRFLRARAHRGTVLIISMASPFWEPILWLLEKLNMKMPEGPHDRMSFKKLERMLESRSFRLTARGTRLLVPSRAVPWADGINRWYQKIPGLRYLGLIGYLVAEVV